MRKYPRLPLSRPFVRARRDSDRSLFNLSASVGFGSNMQLSTMMNAPSVRARSAGRARTLHDDDDEHPPRDATSGSQARLRPTDGPSIASGHEASCLT